MRPALSITALMLLVYCIPSKCEQLSPDLLKTAAECGVLFEMRESGATDQTFKDDQEFRKKFMMALMMKNGLSVDRFTEIGTAYKKEFDSRATKGDEAAQDYVRNEINRCMLFSKQQASRIANKAAAK